MQEHTENYDLIFDQHIIESDEDAPIYACVDIGFNERKAFVAELDFTDSENPGRNFCTRAVIPPKGVEVMAARLKKPITSIPETIKEKFSQYEYGLYTVSEVKSVFKDILDFISDCGIRYTLHD